MSRATMGSATMQVLAARLATWVKQQGRSKGSREAMWNGSERVRSYVKALSTLRAPVDPCNSCQLLEVLPSIMCRAETCLNHRRYRRRASLVAKDIDVDGSLVMPNQARDQITVSYGTGEITGIFVQDKVCLGPPAPKEPAPPSPAAGSVSGASLLQLDRARVETAKTQLQEDEDDDDGKPKTEHGCVDLRLVSATDMTDDPFSSFQFDGVLGLGLPSLSQTSEFNFLEAASVGGSWSSLVPDAERMFGVFLAKSAQEDSEITFGGWENDHILNGHQLAFCDVQDSEEGYWQLEVYGIKADGQKLDFCDDGCRAVVDTGSSLVGVPSALGDQLVDLLRFPASPEGFFLKASRYVKVDSAPVTVGVDCVKSIPAAAYVEQPGEGDQPPKECTTVEEMVKHYRTGEYFGELALLTKAPRRASIRSCGDGQTLLLWISRSDFEQSLGSLRERLASEYLLAGTLYYTYMGFEDGVGKQSQ
eukprot:s2932_g8.t1